MKLKKLLKSIEEYTKHNPEILEYNVYLEQLTEADKNYKRKPCRKDIPWHNENNGQGWEYISDSESWEYFEAHGFHTIFHKEKIFTININF